MNQASIQNITAILLCQDEDKAQEILSKFSPPKLIQDNKTVNIFYEKINYSDKEQLHMYLSIFEHAIYVLPDTEFQNKSWDNPIFQLLNLLYQYKYKQIIILASLEETRQNIAQIQAYCKWIQNECLMIIESQKIYEKQVDDKQIDDKQVDKKVEKLNYPLPEIKTLLNLDAESILQFFYQEQDILNSDLNISVIKQLKDKKSYLVYIISGFVLNGQTLQHEKNDTLVKIQISDFVDYFTQKPINFACQGDVLEIKTDKNEKISGFLFGIFQKKYKILSKDIDLVLVISHPQNKGSSHKLHQSKNISFQYGIQFDYVIKSVAGKKNDKRNDLNLIKEEFIIEPLDAVIKSVKNNFYPFYLKDKSFVFSNTLNKQVKEKVFYYGVFDVEKNFEITVPPQNQERAVILQKINTPAFENMMKDGVDYRQKCRVCRTEKLRFVPNVCGHLRYCVDCKELCKEAKQCLYCDRTTDNVIGFNIFLTNHDIKNLHSYEKKDIIDYFSKDRSQDFKPSMLIDLEINDQENTKYLINCENCVQAITHYSYCKANHVVHLCKNCKQEKCPQCNENMTKCQIISTFHDDPLQ